MKHTSPGSRVIGATLGAQLPDWNESETDKDGGDFPRL